MKRTCDICLATLGVIITSPLLALIALLIKLDSSGPVIFRQIRVGQGFRPFAIRKFRTMVANDSVGGPLVTVGRDCRITRVGHILRGLKLDELPQLWNVLLGDMCLVGPRPEVPRFVECARAEFAEVLTETLAAKAVKKKVLTV